MQFHTTLLTGGKTSTGFEIPAEIVQALGGGKQPLVVVTINGYSYRSAIASRDNRYLCGVSAQVREAAHVAGGDKVKIEIKLDTAPRVVDVPPALADALAAEPQAQAAFDNLSNSKKKLLTYPIEQAKTDETRDRNVQKALTAMRDAARNKKAV